MRYKVCPVASFHSLLILLLISLIPVPPSPAPAILPSTFASRPIIAISSLLLVVFLVPGSSLLLLELSSRPPFPVPTKSKSLLPIQSPATLVMMIM